MGWRSLSSSAAETSFGRASGLLKGLPGVRAEANQRARRRLGRLARHGPLPSGVRPPPVARGLRGDRNLQAIGRICPVIRLDAENFCPLFDTLR